MVTESKYQAGDMIVWTRDVCEDHFLITEVQLEECRYDSRYKVLHIESGNITFFYFDSMDTDEEFMKVA